ncbi:MAG: methyltransferase domain-containing protein [Calditrichia bacterium]
MNSIEQIFNEAAPDYEHNRLSSWYKAHNEFIIDALENSASVDTILDIGCGTGWLLRQMKKNNPLISGIGVDISTKMINVAQAEALQERLDGLSFISADWEKLNMSDLLDIIGDKSLSHITCSSVFHYFGDAESALIKIYNVLNPGGQFLLLDRAKDGSALTQLWDLLHRFFIKDQVKFYTSGELIEMLKRTGFCDLKIKKKVRKLVWKGKFNTSLVLMSAKKPVHLDSK